MAHAAELAQVSSDNLEDFIVNSTRAEVAESKSWQTQTSRVSLKIKTNETDEGPPATMIP
jgi:hypothetical protein